ncbi:RHS repeat-associated core domain-containing protein, partial [Chromobacterium piscinae]
TDEQGQLALEMDYQAWGQAREVIADAAGKAGIRNPFRFQGQYHDDESGLHYNRYRYYDPEIGRFISRDPIGLFGGENNYEYGPDPIQWIDPYGLKKLKPGAQYETHSNRTSVDKVNGRMPINSCYAGKTMPLQDLPDSLKKKYPGVVGKYPHGVPFNMKGFPDFSRYAVKNVNVGGFTTDSADFKRANEAAFGKGNPFGDKAPPGMVWHHNPQSGKLQLLPADIHDVVKHTGGAAICGTRKR